MRLWQDFCRHGRNNVFVNFLFYQNISLLPVYAMHNTLRNVNSKKGAAMHTETTHHASRTMPQRSDANSHQAAEKQSISLTDQVRNKLMLTLDELLRMEDEGGSGVTSLQAEEIQRLSQAIRRLDRENPSEKQTSEHGDIPFRPSEEKHHE
jgi:hypothetical protein